MIPDQGIIDVTGELRLTERTWEWCTLPYPGHSGSGKEPQGCPNFGRKEGCPPLVPWIWESADLDKRTLFAFVRFDLESHKTRMLLKHPGWSDRQAVCCLYWQGSVNKALETLCRDIVQKNPGTVYTLCPEARGVAVIRTAKAVGLPIEVHAERVVHKIGLIYYPREEPRGSL